MKGGRSHYSGPGKGSQKPTVSKPKGVGGSYKQPTGGKTNKNPKGGAPRGSVHDMVF